MFGPGDEEEELGNNGEELGETEAEQAPEDTAPNLDDEELAADHAEDHADDPNEDEVA
jgi:hypothetical protein